MSSTTQTFLILSSAGTAWLFLLWAATSGILKLISLYFPSIDTWRGALTSLLAWGWFVPLSVVIIVAYTALIGVEP